MLEVTIALVLFFFHMYVGVVWVSRVGRQDANAVSLSKDFLLDLAQC